MTYIFYRNFINFYTTIEQDFYFIDLLVDLVIDFDIDPKIYGEKKHKSVVHIDKQRTNFEIKMTRLALKKNKPILGICGGQQLLNVALNGSLIQDIDKTNIKHEQVQINLKSKLYKILKKKNLKLIVRIIKQLKK